MYNKILSLLLFVLLLAFPILLKAQAPPTYDRGMYTAKGDTLPYRVLFPINFDPSKKYALIIVLHGDDERGNDNEAQLDRGSSLFTQGPVRQLYPAIVVFPQCPKDGYWSDVQITHDSTGTKYVFPTDAKPTKAMHTLMGFIDDFLEKPFVNLTRVYIGGTAMGGMATFELIGREPKLFAAAFAICGGDNSLNAKKYAKKVPVWIFHGEKDTVIPSDHSYVMADAIKAAGGDPKFTLYPNDGHDCANDAFAEPGLMQWLFSHSK